MVSKRANPASRNYRMNAYSIKGQKKGTYNGNSS
jgi:hypothetical protein